jgi:hypothetical protein
VTSSDSGIEIAVTIVERTENRKSRITSTAKIRPSPPSVVRSSTDFSMNGAWSKATVMSAPEPRDSSSSPIRSATWWEMSTVLPSGVLVIASERLGSPFVRAYDVGATCATCTFATRPSGWVPSPTATGTARSCSSVVGVLPTWTDRLWSPASRLPAGTIEAPRSASAMAPALTPWAAAAGSGVISTRSWGPPVSCTSRTPSMSSSSGIAIRSRSLASLAASASEVTDSCTTGNWSKSPANTIGSTCSGSASRPVTADSTCCCARSRSVP